MAMEGKLIGTSLGWILGGPVVGLIGCAIGHALDSSSEETGGPADENQIKALILGIYTAAADSNNELHPKEKRRLMSIGSELFPDLSADDMEELIESLRATPHSPDLCGNLIREAPEDVRPLIIRDMLSVLSADGGIDDVEFAWLDQVVAASGMDRGIWHCLLLCFVQPDSRAAKAAALEVLGMSGNPTGAEIKAAYRKLAMDYHPDRLGSLPDHIRKLAEEKFQQIQSAYEELMSGGQCGESTFFRNEKEALQEL